jgi:hypothetical protein
MLPARPEPTQGRESKADLQRLQLLMIPIIFLRKLPSMTIHLIQTRERQEVDADDAHGWLS